LDIVLMDEPATAAAKFKAHNHPLGSCGISFCAHRRLARKLPRTFPQCLHQTPALLPAHTSTVRHALDKWFQSVRVTPTIMAEFEDAALIKVMAASGLGFIAIPTAMETEAVGRYDFQVLGRTDKCREYFYAVTAERKMHHPAVAKLTEQAQRGLFA
jgi:LysR family transcriptional activator of nhaA